MTPSPSHCVRQSGAFTAPRGRSRGRSATGDLPFPRLRLARPLLMVHRRPRPKPSHWLHAIPVTIPFRIHISVGEP